MNITRRLKRISLSPDVLVILLRGGSGGFVEERTYNSARSSVIAKLRMVTTNLPDDVKLVGVQWSYVDYSVVFVISSETFPEIEPGIIDVPHMMAEATTYHHSRAEIAAMFDAAERTFRLAGKLSEDLDYMKSLTIEEPKK